MVVPTRNGLKNAEPATAAQFVRYQTNRFGLLSANGGELGIHHHHFAEGIKHRPPAFSNSSSSRVAAMASGIARKYLRPDAGFAIVKPDHEVA